MTADAYERVRSTDPAQQRHMILHYVTTYGSITHSQVMSLCAVGTTQARALLRTLVQQRQLQLHGTRRAARYQRRIPPV